MRNSKGQFIRGHAETPIGNTRWSHPNAIATRFKPEVKPPYSYFHKGMIPWNKDKDFGGTEHLVNRISGLSIYRQWKKAILKRDNNSCVVCGDKRFLNIDHSPISLSTLVQKYNIQSPQEAKNYSEFWDINNGRTLCFPCHKLTPTYGRNIHPKSKRNS